MNLTNPDALYALGVGVLAGGYGAAFAARYRGARTPLILLFFLINWSVVLYGAYRMTGNWWGALGFTALLVAGWQVLRRLARHARAAAHPRRHGDNRPLDDRL